MTLTMIKYIKAYYIDISLIKIYFQLINNICEISWKRKIQFISTEFVLLNFVC